MRLNTVRIEFHLNMKDRVMPKFIRTAIVFAVILSLTGLADAATVTYDVVLRSGWNLVSIPVIPAQPYLRSDFVAEAATQGVTVNRVASLENGRWQVYVNGLPFNDKPLLPNDAFMVHSEGGTVTLTGEPGVELPTHTPYPTYTHLPTCPGEVTPEPTLTDTPTVSPTDVPTSTFTPTPDASHGAVFGVDNIVGILRFIPGGTFTQGSPEGEPCRSTNETQFSHTLTRDFVMMETEVTRAMWASLKAVQSSLPSDPTVTSSGSGSLNPVQNVRWDETLLFANLLSQQQGLTPAYYKNAGFTDVLDATNYTTGTIYCNFDSDGYRLPLEGEWEYAARAGTTSPFSASVSSYSSGNCETITSGILTELEALGWFAANSGSMTQPVGSKTLNPWNLADMHGNVGELVWDLYAATYPGASTNYTGGTGGNRAVVRGGSWNSKPSEVRSAFRFSPQRSNTSHEIGFRLVRTIPLCKIAGPTCTPTPTPTTTPTGTPTPTSTPTPTPTAVSAWAARASMPTALIGHVAGYESLSQWVFVADGAAGEENFWHYNSGTNTWLARTSMGLPVNSAAAVVHAGKMFTFGGILPLGTSALAQCSYFWTFSNAWDFAELMPQALSAHSAVVNPATGIAYIFGGLNGSTRYNTVFAYNIGSNTWTTLANNGTPPSARTGHFAVWDDVNSRMIIGGGFTGSGNFLADTFAYSPATQTWTQLESLPFGLNLAAAAWDNTNKRILVHGGQSNPDVSQQLLAFSGGTWTVLETTTAPGQRFWHRGVWVSNQQRFMVLGGMTPNGFSAETWWW